jgi:hypothetical protein
MSESEYQHGRAAAVFSTGTKIEELGESYEREAQNLNAMKLAFGMAGNTLETYLHRMLTEVQAAKIPLKEAEYGRIYVNRCIELMKQLFNDTEAKRLQAAGAAAALKQATGSVKRLYDEEKAKADAHAAWENDPEREQRDRPPGMNPGKPIDEYKQEPKKPSRRTRPQQ